MIVPKPNASATEIIGWDTGASLTGGSGSISGYQVGYLSDGLLTTYLQISSTAIPFSNTVTVTYDQDYSFSNPLSVSFYALQKNVTGPIQVDIFFPNNGPVYRYLGVVSSWPAISSPSYSNTTLCSCSRILDTGVNNDNAIKFVISLPNDTAGINYVYLLDVNIDIAPAPPPMPNLDGYIYDLEVDGTNFRDCRNYVQALFDLFIENDFYQAVYLPYYTISKWYVSNAFYYWTIILSEEPIISTANADSYLTVSDGTFMMYSGLVPEEGYSTTLYYNGYYAPGADPVLLYEKGLNEWVGINGNVSSVLMSGADVYQYQLDYEYRKQSYEVVTNYLIDNNTGVQPSEGLIYTNSTIPQGWFDLYNQWRAAGGDSSGEVLAQILAKVIHIDNDIHDIFLDDQEYKDGATAAVDDLINSGAGAASSAIGSTNNAVSDIVSSSGEILGAVSGVTAALGEEWTMLVALAGFGLVALILQRRTG